VDAIADLIDASFLPVDLYQNTASIRSAFNAQTNNLMPAFA
jgi:hypothetical protein